MQQERPKIGVGVYIVKDGKVLLGQRRGTSGNGMWCPPGGHLEMYETFEECVKRETQEEAGVEIENIRLITPTNDFNKDVEKHYVTLHFRADWKSGEPRELEPEKMGNWSWYFLNNLPQPLFYPSHTFLNTGISPLEI